MQRLRYGKLNARAGSMLTATEQGALGIGNGLLLTSLFLRL